MQQYGISRMTSRTTLSDVSASTSSTGSHRASPSAAPFSSSSRGTMHDYDDRSDNNVYLRGLPEHTSEDMLTTWARAITEPVSVKVVRQRAPHERMSDSSTLWDMGPCTGIGFVSFHTRGAAVSFIELVNTADNKPGLASVTACFAKETYTGRMEKAADRDSANLYLSHIPLSYTESDVHALFPLALYDVKSLRLLREGDRPGARGSPLTKFKGAAFCRLASREMAQLAINNLDGKRLPGHEKRYSPTTGEAYYESLQVRFADSERQKFVKLVDREHKTVPRSVRSSSSGGSLHEQIHGSHTPEPHQPTPSATHQALSTIAALSTFPPLASAAQSSVPTPQQVAEATAILQQYLASVALPQPQLNPLASPSFSIAATQVGASNVPSAMPSPPPQRSIGSATSRWADKSQPTSAAYKQPSPISPPSKQSSGDDQSIVGMTRSLSIADPANNIWQFKPEELRFSLHQHALTQNAQAAQSAHEAAGGVGQRRGTHPVISPAEYPAAAFTPQQPKTDEDSARASSLQPKAAERSSMDLPYVQPDFTFGTYKTQDNVKDTSDLSRTRTNTINSAQMQSTSSLDDYWAAAGEDSRDGTPTTSRRHSNASDDIEERYLSSAEAADQAFTYAAGNKHRASDAGTSTPGSTHSRSTGGTPTTLFSDPSSLPGRKASSPF